MKPRYTTVLLDADNTLFDFDAAEEQALQWLMETLGLPAEESARYLAINRALWHQHDLGQITADALVVERFRRFLEETGVQADPVALNKAYLNQLGTCPALLPGAMDLCRRLSQYCTLAIVTNGMPSVQHSRVAQSGLQPYLSFLFISGEMGCRKPERVFFEQVFQTMGLTEADKPCTLMVGDNLLSDVAGGQGFGLDTVWFARNAAVEHPKPVPTYVAMDLKEIETIVLGA